MKTQMPKTLILATSYAPEKQPQISSSPARPRTDYIELAKLIDSDIIDYSFYNNHFVQKKLKSIEERFRMDFILALEGIRRSSKYDVTLLMSERVAIPFAFICKCTGKTPRTIMMSMHSSLRQATLIKSLKLYKAFSQTISFTPAQEYFLTQDMNIAKGSISYVPYAVDNSFYSTKKRNEESFILSAGGVPGRDYKTLIDAIRGTNIPLWIVTGGRWYGRRTSGYFDQIPDNVRILSGLDNIQMRDLYNRASMVIVPLKKDRSDAAGSSVALEAMSVGCPLVVSSSPGIRHYLDANINSVLVEPEDPQALRETILQLTADTKKKADLGKNAINTINSQLSIQHYIERLRQIICGEVISWPLG